MLDGRRVLSVVVATVLSVNLAGCGIRYLGDSTAMITKADQRLVVNLPAKLETGRNAPRQIFCAEPSPDVAKALAESTNLSGSLDAVVRAREAPAEGALKAAAAISRARAEALAQLTNRLATIQLLRDSLYRACEAYANGALSEITYAIILSRFDKLMVTLLTGELVAGNFGQSLAVLGTSSSGVSHAAALKAQQDASKAADSQQTVDTARSDLDTKQGEAAVAKRDRDACLKTAAAPGDCADKQATLDDKNHAVVAANNKLTDALVNTLGDVTAAASSTASVVTAQGVGALSAGQASAGQADVTKTLGTMQQRFLENINADPLVVACLTAFDRDRGQAATTSGGADASGGDSQGTTLVRFCQKEFPLVLRAQQDLLRAKLINSQAELIQGCAGAFQEAASSDPKIGEAAKALSTFCEKNVVQILRTQAELALNEKQLQDARLELDRKRREEPAKPVTAQPSK